EDLQGKPFVGPAGRLLEKGLEEAGIDRRRVYVTNAVKHFRWTRRGKRRLHEKPNAGQVRACRPWLEAEIEVVKPQVIVLPGATAAQSVMGGQRRPARDDRAQPRHRRQPGPRPGVRARRGGRALLAGRRPGRRPRP